MSRTYREVLAAAGEGKWTKEDGYVSMLSDEDYQVLVDRFKNDPEYVMRKGSTNDECVNLAIACGMLGIDFKEMVRKEMVDYVPQQEFDRVMEHVERIEPYIDKWCNSGYAPIYMIR